jgi:hypothetical protein
MERFWAGEALLEQLLVSTPAAVGVGGVFTVHSPQLSLAISSVSLCELSPAQVLVFTPAASQVAAVVTDQSPQACSCEGWLLEDGEPPPELEERELPLPELLEDGASSPSPPPPSPPQALSVNAMASIKPAAIAGAKNLLPLLLSFVSIFFSFLGFNGLDYLII